MSSFSSTCPCFLKQHWYLNNNHTPMQPGPLSGPPPARPLHSHAVTVLCAPRHLQTPSPHPLPRLLPSGGWDRQPPSLSLSTQLREAGTGNDPTSLVRIPNPKVSNLSKVLQDCLSVSCCPALTASDHPVSRVSSPG